MPIYEYVCTTCRNRFEKLRPMAAVAVATSCPDCGSPAQRVLSVFASFSRSAGGEMQPIAGGGGCACSMGGACGCSAGMEF